MKIIALTDCMTQYHSFWVRIGQYLYKLGHRLNITITYDHTSINNLKNSDVLIFYRYSLEWGDLSEYLEDARKRGVNIISDVDDYLWNDGELRGWSKERLKLYTRALKKCSTLTCSTGYLKDQLSTMFRKQKIIVLENTAPAYITEKHKSKTGKIRIGWTGAPWIRPYDLNIIKPLGKWIEAHDDKVELIHIGHSEKFMSLAEALDINQSKVHKVPLCGHEEYMSEFNFDIGLAPLEENCFNSFKSAIKVIEYSANGIPWVASNTRIYRNLCQKWAWKGRLCRHEEDWIKHIKNLLDDQTRNKEGILVKKRCEQYSNHSSGVERWKDVILGL